MKVILKIHLPTLLKYGLLLFLGTALLGGAIGFYLYEEYAQRVDKAILEQPWDHIPTITSAPTILFPGQQLPLEWMADTLERRGYVRSTFLEQPPAWHRPAGGRTLRVANRKGDQPGPDRFEVTFDNGGLAAIRDLDTGRPVERAYLRPAVLSAQRAGLKRMTTRYRELPANLVYAVLSAEDQHFFDHPGIDFQGIFRSLLRNAREEERIQGGSTITQQLTKNIFLSPRRTWERKYKEALIALILETRLSKEQIFEIYADQVYLGQTASFSIHGFAQGAQIYCHKDIRNLNLEECALLAGMIRSPNQCHPFRHPREAFARRNQVLAAMEAEGYIGPEERQAAGAAPLPAPDPALFEGLQAPYFLDYLAAQAPAPIGDRASPPAYAATLNLELQAAAEQAVAEGLRLVRQRMAEKFPSEDPRQAQGAMVVLDPVSGGILAMAGGEDYRLSQYNRAVYGRRQAGSILKPFIYAYLLDLGRREPSLDLTSGSIVDDRPCSIRYGRRVYRPHNYLNAYHGQVTMRTALVHSLNTATVLFAQRAGFDRIADMLNQLGFARRAVPYPSIALGTVDVSPLEVADAYTVFYHQGRRRPSRWRIDPAPEEIALRPALFGGVAAAETVDMLREAVDRGTGANIRRQGITTPLAGKTGTARDGWFVGLLGNLIVCSWTGYDENREFPFSGGDSALHLFTAFLRHAQAVYPVQPLEPPPPPS
jgi:penicillin-binding protein 1B